MKSINAKKIAAVTTGAVLLGASLVAAAPIMYGNTEIINAQGKPVVKVVVGANAKASDGVAAANIAAVIGSLAYKTQTVSAQLTGSPTCAVSGTGSGSCSVSDEKVTLEITTPGTATVAGGYGFKTYGYGFIDNVGTSEDNQIYNESNPKEIDGDDISAFADYESSISSVSGAFTETQKMFVHQDSAPAKWDSDEEKYYIDLKNITYKITFDHNEFNGVPMCVDESELTSGNCSDDNTIDRQRLKIKYLGEEWIISDMSNGTSVKLAKEASPAQIVYAGQSITAGAYTVKLADLTIPHGNIESMAIVQIYDANEQLVKEDTAAAGATKEITLPNGDKISLHVYKTAPGLTTSKWAEMAVFTQELTLTDGSSVDDDANEDWIVDLSWYKYGASSNDVLTGITLTRTDFVDSIFEGDSVNIIESPAPYQFTFSGWDITDAQRDTLVIDWETIRTYYNSTSSSDSISIDDGKREYVCFESAKKAFNEFTSNGTMSSGNFADDRYKFCYGVRTGMLLYNKDGKYYNATDNSSVTSDDDYSIDYTINDDSSYDNGADIVINGSADGETANVTIYERLVKDNSSTFGYFAFNAKADDKEFVDNPTDDSTSQVKVGYIAANDGLADDTADREAGFVSQKGSVLSSRSDDSITLKMAKKLGEFQFFVKPSSSSVSAGTSTQTLSEGQQITVQDSTVKVSSISETVGACSVSGGESACTASSEGMSAVLDVAGTPSSASFAVPYAFSASDRLVVLDSEAPSAESLILVGGQLVNTVTASTIAGTDVKIDTPGVKVVSAVSDQRIVVAGYTAADTQEAAAQFVSQLLAQVQ